MKRLSASLLALAALGVSSVASAQAFPAKPIRLTVTVPAAGAADVAARLATPRMVEALGQPIIVENNPGMFGSIAAERVAHSAPDGYNLMFTTPSPTIVIFFQKKRVAYKLSDFTPITAAVETVTTIVVNPSVPVNSLKELIDYAKRNPGKLTYGSPGIGSTFHLMAEAFMHDAGIEMLHVPYKGVISAVNDLASGQINVSFSAVSNVRSYLVGGKLKVLAVLEGQRYAGLPNVPTAGEVIPNYEKPASWFALFGPAGMPAPITQRLYLEMAKSLNSPDVKAKLEAAGMTVVANTPEQFAAAIKRGYEVYGAVFKAAGLQPED
jgi:tripartite-type tricarboxylate transporter receptor subunit TctC